MSATEAEKPEEKKAAAGEVLFCGATNWEIMGRKTGSTVTGNLSSPTRLRSLMNIDIRYVASGCRKPESSSFVELLEDGGGCASSIIGSFYILFFTTAFCFYSMYKATSALNGQK